MRRIVVKPYRTSTLPAHVFVAGTRVRAEKRDDDFPEWWWCTSEDGASAWIHESYLELGQETSRVTRWYTNREINVDAGDCVEEMERLGGWVLVERGDEIGWILESSL